MENRIIQKLAEHQKAYGLPIGGKFLDIGIPQDYVKAQEIIPQVLQKERKPEIFVDRDGKIIEVLKYVYGKNLIFIGRTIEFLRKEKENGKYVIIVTNQAGIAKGEFSEEESFKTTEYVMDQLRKVGVDTDSYCYCPYHPNGVIERYRKKSLARKPEPGMVL